MPATHNQAPHTHLVQFYNDDCFLADTVGSYLAEGLNRGEGAVVIATGAHIDLFREHLRGAQIDAASAERSGHLLLLDAQTTLSLFMVGDRPDWNGFERAIGAVISRVAAVSGAYGVRAYGEMVGLLWQEGKVQAAITLEEYWNDLLGMHSCKLFCGYPIDVFGSMFEMSSIDAVLCAHTHLLPTDGNGALDSALDRSMNEVLGSKVEGLRLLMSANFRPAWATIPRAESTILWLRRNLPSHADRIMSRAQHYFREAQAGPEAALHV